MSSGREGTIGSPAGPPGAFGTPGPPQLDAWIAAVHQSADDFTPLGAAVVIDSSRVLTCAHVIVSEGVIRSPLWVAFPKTAGSARCKVSEVRHVYVRPVRDLAMLVLEEPVPAGVEPAPLRFPEGRDLVNQGWWAFGFHCGSPVNVAPVRRACSTSTSKPSAHQRASRRPNPCNQSTPSRYCWPTEPGELSWLCQVGVTKPSTGELKFQVAALPNTRPR